MKVADRITTIEQALHSGLIRLTVERQTELSKELDLLNDLRLKGGANADLADIYQSGPNWAVPGCSGFYENEEAARLRSIQLTAQAAGIEMPNACLEEPATRLMPAALAEVLRDLAATGAGARYAKHLMESANQLNCLQLIYDELDGQEWNADAFDNISGYLSAAGLDVRDSNNLEDEVQPGPSGRWY